MEYKRAPFTEILHRINEPRGKMQVIVGPRQVGKSTLIGQILEECTIPFDSYSADDVTGVSADWLAQAWESQRMKMFARGESKRLMVIDEIQKIKNWSETVKAEWDRDTREKRELVIVLLGSSRMLIEKGLTESLAGRFELIRLAHWTYAEMKDCFGWSLQQYVYFGGYPGAAQFINNENRWRNYVKNSLIEPSISKDILMDTKIMKPQLLRQLFELGSSYSGELLSLTKIAAQLQDTGNVTTLAGYLHLLDECGLLCGLQKFAEDDARKYNSVPKFQVHNNALRNVYVDDDFSEVIEDPKLWGRYIESAIGAYLVSQAQMNDYKVYYWRDHKDEVDFILVRRKKKIAIEVKSGRRTTNQGISVFTKMYKPYKALVIGSGGLSFEEFLSMDIDLLFK
ncbi:ATP-binding protein [Butyricimonas synergistica]|uniref:ATP-binding protein n=1 Tax=Butyricimonas synergistica TaxID=544644 RepID=UPI00037C76CB|nr:AAA family ATPase [Butyricimonas synergistica]